jgi:GxxExxY protein
MGIENTIGQEVVDAAVQLHRELGPGLLESVYEATLAEEVKQRGYRVQTQVSVPLTYLGVRLEQGFRIDLHIEGCVIVEIKSTDGLTDAHRKQLLTYLRLTDNRLGFLLNFGEARMRDGIVRMVNNLKE